MNVAVQRRMTVPEFLDWAIAQPKGRYELVNGQAVVMSPERALHIMTKTSVWQALSQAVRAAGLPCTVYGDGLSVPIDEYRARQPDVLVQCGKPFDPETLIADEPIVVVEVISPSSVQTDTVDKLKEYFSVASIAHYLVVDPEARTIIHHARGENAEIRIRSVRIAEIELSPPGFSISVDALFAGIPS